MWMHMRHWRHVRSTVWTWTAIELSRAASGGRGLYTVFLVFFKVFPVEKKKERNSSVGTGNLQFSIDDLILDTHLTCLTRSSERPRAASRSC